VSDARARARVFVCLFVCVCALDACPTRVCIRRVSEPCRSAGHGPTQARGVRERGAGSGVRGAGCGGWGKGGGWQGGAGVGDGTVVELAGPDGDGPPARVVDEPRWALAQLRLQVVLADLPPARAPPPHPNAQPRPAISDGPKKQRREPQRAGSGRVCGAGQGRGGGRGRGRGRVRGRGWHLAGVVLAERREEEAHRLPARPAHESRPGPRGLRHGADSGLRHDSESLTPTLTPSH
jgi:hypothetical protein